MKQYFPVRMFSLVNLLEPKYRRLLISWNRWRLKKQRRPKRMRRQMRCEEVRRKQKEKKKLRKNLRKKQRKK